MSLVKQTLEVYLRETDANNDKVSWLCVCSDEGIGTNDDVAIYTNEIGVPCVTDKNYIAKWLKDNSKNKTIIFSTYQSGKTIAEACKIAKHSFDLGIMDEAHKTVGDKEKLFSHLLFDKNIKIKKRIFMTATERRYAGSSDTILSMDDAEVYGDTFTQLSFKKAIELGILSDYKIITLFISNNEVRKLIEKNAFVKPIGKDWNEETEARTLAALIAIRKAMTDYPINHAVTFHSSIKKAEAFEQSQVVFSKVFPKYSKVNSYHVSGAMPTSVRGKIVDEFASSEKGIITNAKCLTEGVDVPNIDCVLFADPRKSKVDIIQAVGRALRKKQGKEFGYVILPVFTDANNKEEIIESEEFKDVLTTIRALASNDERIIEEFKDISKGKKGNRKEALVQFNIDVNIAELINENELIESIQLKTWDKIAKLTWMPFEEARVFVSKLGLNAEREWRIYLKSGHKPFDIPSDPAKVYRNSWVSMGDFLGTGRIADQYKEYETFEEARVFAHSLCLKSSSEWKKYCNSGNLPNRFPKTPRNVYKDKWISVGDFLGTGIIANQNKKYKSYIESRDYVRSLRIKSNSEWMKFCKSGKKPNDVPTGFRRYYKKEFTSMGDFLGTGRVADQFKEYRSFEGAKIFISSLKLNSQKEWFNYCKSGKKPDDIPTDLYKVYGGKFASISEFLGTTNIASHLRKYKSLYELKSLAKLLKIKSQADWYQYWKNNQKPLNIPISPQTTYNKKGWTSWGEFLGTGRVADQLKDYVSFSEAKIYANKKGIKSISEWRKVTKSKVFPKDIPKSLEGVYKSEWKGWADFLGKK